MNLTIETGIPAVTVFLQGLLSFFSPCVLPLIPLYMGYLSGGAKTVDEDGSIRYKRGKVMANTLFFVIGISFAFFLLGLGFTAIGKFFHNYQTWFTKIGGIVILLFGLSQLGIFGSSSSGREHRLRFSPDALAMSPFTALLLGFTFSFAWTPCVGPALASVLIMATSASSFAAGFLLIGVYTAGFVLPFMAVGLFTGSLLDFFKKHRGVVRYTVKTGGVLMILIGVMMFTGWMNGISSYLSGSGGQIGKTATPDTNVTVENDPSAAADNNAAAEDDPSAAADNNAAAEDDPSASAGDHAARENSIAADDNSASPNDGTDGTDDAADTVAAPDFTLVDQFGTTHTLSDYKGKTVFLNFGATWCPPCRVELPEIQEIYEDYGENASDVIILGIASPDYGREGSSEEITAFLEDNGYTYPTIMDTGGQISYAYGISAYPTTFMIDKDGNVFGYVSGQITKEIMQSIIEQTRSGVHTP